MFAQPFGGENFGFRGCSLSSQRTICWAINLRDLRAGEEQSTVRSAYPAAPDDDVFGHTLQHQRTGAGKIDLIIARWTARLSRR